jgi:preprotein translocase subunit SecG
MSGTAFASGGVVWSGKPSISVYLLLYGVAAVVAAAILVLLEVWTGDNVSVMSSLIFSSAKVGSLTIPDVLEVATVLVILVLYLVKVLRLSLYKAGHSYELHTDGLYVNRGIANLQNTFISAMAFSDARLIRSLGMRIVRRSTIIVEANDGRKFEMRMLKDGVNVQTMIRNNLAHPTVRVEK